MQAGAFLCSNGSATHLNVTQWFEEAQDDPEDVMCIPFTIFN